MTALAGVRVVDFSRYAPGLFGTRILAGLGADVISVEVPGPESESPLYPNQSARAQERHPFFRGRRSLTLNLRDERHLQVAHKLIASADVVVEGFRPGVADRLRVGFQEARTLNPAIAYISVTGYGQSGPDVGRPGHDINYCAEAGVLSLTSARDAEPGVPLNLLADIAGGGMATAIAILGALHHTKSGDAQYVDVAMVRSLLTMLAPVVAMRDAGMPDPSWRQGVLNGAAPYYRCYRTSDGWVAVGSIERQFFAELCRGTGLERFLDKQHDQSAWSELTTALEAVFATRTREEWGRDLADAAVTPVLTVSEAWARNGEPDPSSFELFGEPRSPDTYATAKDTGADDVLAELGLTEAEIEALRQS